ncbi:hypothetical protein [Cryptosporangium sp. NPDC051539]|uniref:hypothetical protein n=1 Tax=Cryptosporangium sp. NPDC051539 TaxID=3363962 RepID=UPI0037AF4162
MSAPTTTPQAQAPKADEKKQDEKATFNLEVSEQELLDEFGVLSLAEYTYGA